MFKFPLIMPEVTVTPLPGEDFEVEMTDMGSGFALLELGAETEFAFYDYPKDTAPGAERRLVLTGAHRICVTRRIRVDDFEMLEIHSYYADVGMEYAGSPAIWNQVINETGLRSDVEVQAPGVEAWTYKLGQKTIFPRLLSPDLKVEGHEPHHTAREYPERVVNWLMEVIGAATVRIGPKSYRCLRVIWTFHGFGGDSLLEIFVADVGRTIYVRRYNGSNNDRYDEFAGNPEMVYNGITWRHWYDCLPDNALIIGR
jgi:hypothetical protein